jgi:amidase
VSQSEDEGQRFGRMTRRAFVGAGALGGALAMTGPLLPGAAAAEAADKPAAAAAVPPGSGAATVPPFDLEEATLHGLGADLASGKRTARSLVEAYTARIEALDRRGPELRFLLELNPDALAIADELDAERKAKGPRGPLHGIPILLKDNIATADKMNTTAGSLALVGAVAKRDSFVAERLRAAGAVILGKTNLSEWANFRSTHSSSGWSGRGGQCRNPYALDRTPSGSSSGSGSAVAASAIPVAIGSETDGSIVSPSAAASLVGIKPTIGLVSRSGIIPISHSQDTAGPMARTVTDAAILLGALTGVDPRDTATADSPGRAQTDYTKFLDPNGLRGVRIGVPRKRFFGYSVATDRIAEAALEVMRKQGAILVDPAELETAGQFDDTELEVLLYEFKADLNQYLADLDSSPVRTLKELIDWNEKNASREMPYFQQELFLQAQAKGPLSDDAYQKALDKNHRLSRRDGIDATMMKHKLDAIVAPTQGPAWLIDLVNGDSAGGSSTTPAAVAGYPSITVPAGYSFGLPVGMSFFGAAWSEPLLLKIAYAFEQATKHRRAPRYLATADVAAGA